jgi:hypothetical protein
VVIGEHILGIVSIGDLTKHKLAEQRTEIDHIVGYMQGIPTPATFGSICYGRSESIRRPVWRGGNGRTADGAHRHSGAHVERWGSR